MTIRRTSIKQHAAGGSLVTGPLSVSGAMDVASKAVIKALQANSTFMGVTTVLSGLTTSVVSITTVKSDSFIMLTPITANASNLAANYSINPASTVDGISFMVITSGITVLDVPVNYMVVETI